MASEKSFEEDAPVERVLTLPLAIEPNERPVFSGSSSLDFGSKDKPSDPVLIKEGEVQKSDNLTAYLQVVGAFFMMFNSWGISNTFGAFQTFYESNLLQDQTPSQISWIGSIYATLLLIVGGIGTGRIFDAGHMRGLVIFGTITSVFGMMMTSLCTKYWQILLAQGIVMGTGGGCFMLPSVAVMPQYFKERRAFATGIAAAGSSIGGVVYPVVFHQLQPRVGFGWATRIMGFIMLATLMIPVAVMRAKVYPSSRRPLVDWKVLRNVPWDLFSLGSFFGYMGMFVPFYYLATYSIEKGIMSTNAAFYTLTVMNAGSIFGRLIPNFYADAIGPLNITLPFILFCGIVAFTWISITSVAGVFLFAFFYGFFSGTFVSITGPTLAVLSPDLALVGTHMGMSFGIGGLGLLIGNPVAGVLLDGFGWKGSIYFCGACNMVAAGCVLWSRIVKTGWVVWIKT